MTDIFLLRTFTPPLTLADVQRMFTESSGCMELYNILWKESYLKDDGRRMLCRFSGPDTESVRMMLSLANSPYETIWPGTVHEAVANSNANVIVERSFDQATSVAALQRIENEGAWCLEIHNVNFIRTFFSADQKQMLCLYRAPDAESVRQAQRKAKMPLSRVWSGRYLTPENLDL